MERMMIHEIPGFSFGQVQDLAAGTGCTVILCPEGGVTGVDVRGGSPGTRDTDALNPVCNREVVHAVVLTGGSAFGLDAAGVCISDAQRALARLTGEDATEATIDEVFSTFCVGK